MRGKSRAFPPMRGTASLNNRQQRQELEAPMLDRLTTTLKFQGEALALRAQRQEVLASNIANADTPNYKARDFDFYATLAGVDEAPLPLAVTQVGHVAAGAQADAGIDLKYRNPYQASLDGNTVEAPVEQANFAENSVRYQASLGFINQTIATLQLAINGS